MASAYEERPWLAHYGAGRASDITPEFTDALSMFRAAETAAPEQLALAYFDGETSFRQLDEWSTALASSLVARGLRPGEPVALYLQNVPQFVIALVAAWKAGGVPAVVNPMNRERELRYQLQDCGAAVLVCLEDLYQDVAASVVPDTDVRVVVTTSELEYQTRHDPRLFASVSRRGLRGPEAGGAETWADLVAEGLAGGHDPLPDLVPAPDDIALLTYTSGTTGPPKGSMSTHANVTFNAQVFRDWVGLSERDITLAIAPLFHITGTIGHVAVSLLTRMPLVLAYRFDPGVMLDVIRERRPTFTVGAITAFTALLNAPGVSQDDFRSFRALYTGGAPVSPAAARRVKALTGLGLHNSYGMTETTSPTHAVPFGADTPVDPVSGALSIGVPVPNTVVRVVDDDGHDVPPGQVGELASRGPQIVPGYWGKPEETAHAIRDGWLFTGDVGLMGPGGWFYLVDRKKDMIIAAGYKVWPREVEDVLAEHPAVREVAVVGVPDEYRGETVKAFVSLRRGAQAEPEELIAFARARLAAYKYPRLVEVIDEVPKTVTGKILRRELRSAAPRP